MKFNFNMDRIRGEGGRGQRTESPVVVICITRGIGGLNGDSPAESVGSLCPGHSGYLSVIAWLRKLSRLLSQPGCGLLPVSPSPKGQSPRCEDATSLVSYLL